MIKKILAELKANPLGQLAVLVIALVAVAILFGPSITPHDPEHFSLAQRNKPPAFLAGGSWTYVLGTDTHGRDVFSRIIIGARVSLGTAVAGVAISVLIGATLGLVAGFLGGLWDTVIMRLVDVLLSIPLILMALLVVAIMGPSTLNIILVMGGTGWIWHARIVRGNALRIREEQYVLAARASGGRAASIIWRHVLPNLLAPLMVTASMQVGYFIILESGLSFFGVTGSTLSWGWDIAFGRRYLASAWWIATFPGVAIFLAVLAFNLLGDVLRDVADPTNSAGRS
ncbi:ABC transporter permease [Acuticoccus mangrovi]|uniref:ABC transporter permease n=1 Tax=Acuticoccus mangrovi TaxID=2796142 RepID=A0A934MLL8_9HYPH|nr:ABC transporter permease [Acuticoccus mangrovi]MBJ3776489.1 ABC transporter permease [Acuticoccus mangrovi]